MYVIFGFFFVYFKQLCVYFALKSFVSFAMLKDVLQISK